MLALRGVCHGNSSAPCAAVLSYERAEGRRDVNCSHCGHPHTAHLPGRRCPTPVTPLSVADAVLVAAREGGWERAVPDCTLKGLAYGNPRWDDSKSTVAELRRREKEETR